MPSLQELIGKIKNPSPEDLAVVERAYTQAETAHKDHKRYSGEPYFIHLFETACILADLGMGAEAIAAGLLHDSIEDVGMAPETIRNEFGSSVLMLVEGVTELGHLRYRGVDRYSTSLQQLFIASAKDMRVIIIKLADRLHNMRTLGFVPKEKQYRIAKETLEIYAPLAYRLGIRKINRELEELSFPYVYPEEHERVKKLFKEKGTELIRKLDKFHKSLLKGLSKRGIGILRSSHRTKGLYSLYQKLKSRSWNFEEVYDVLALRVIVASVEDCYRTLGVIHSIWRPLPGRIKDYIAFPKPNGYRSLHTTIFTGDGGVVEIQIRTEEMHRESEYGVALHFEYKEYEKKGLGGDDFLSWTKRLISTLFSWRTKETEAGGTSARQSEVPAWVRELGASSTMGEQGFWTNLKDDFFKNRVFIFTPKGDVVDLPTDSSPIDFAFAIHSDIGDHMFGAKVNGKLVSIDTALKNGDIVEILTKESAHPSPKWLDITKTTIAKKHIRAALARQKPM